MLLIYVPKLTNRVGYTINVVMRDLIKIDFAITTDTEVFNNHEEARLCYAPQPVNGTPDSNGELPYIYLKSARLLFETSIEEQSLHCFKFDGHHAMFPVFGRHTALPFDPFASIFFMLPDIAILHEEPAVICPSGVDGIHLTGDGGPAEQIVPLVD